MNHLYWALDGHDPYPVDVMAFSMLMNDPESRRVELTQVFDWRISTVFLGIDHQFGFGPPLLFETMVFGYGGPGDEEGCWRYPTWQEAEEGHALVVGHYRNKTKRLGRWGWATLATTLTLLTLFISII